MAPFVWLVEEQRFITRDSAFLQAPTYHQQLTPGKWNTTCVMCHTTGGKPRILGRELKLSPIVIVISVVFWGGLWGVVGAFLAVPLTSAAQIILNTHESTRPIAVMLSSGPPKERRMRARRKAREEEATAVPDARSRVS